MQKLTKNVDIDYWVTDDGRNFTTESDAKHWEERKNNLKIKDNLKTMELKFPLSDDVDILSNEWIFVSNKDELNYLTKEYAQHNQFTRIREAKELKLGDWVALEYSFDSEGCKEQYGLVTLSYVLKQMKKFIVDVESNTVDGQF